jgi:murein DD-endopeptidase MepM/ murein hydrolase activator NlpD
LYKELSLAAKQLNIGYYGWRAGTLIEIKFPQGQFVRLSPQLNPGSIAVQFFFSKIFNPPEWGAALYAPGDFVEHYRQLFGDPWQRTGSVGPLFPDGLAQPPLELPFSPGERWSLTGGPHIAWNTGTPRSALDFAPVTGEAACSVSRAWVLASAGGQVVRSRNSAVVLDLDGDGSEATGWVLFYLHIAAKDRISEGAWVDAGTPLGHPSCEGGNATGTHVHVARKYNGEWMPADAPVPFVLGGWQAHAGSRAYEGALTRDGQVVSANPGGSRTSIIIR